MEVKTSVCENNYIYYVFFGQLSSEIVDLSDDIAVQGNYVSIPKTIYIVVGKEFRMYYNNVISRTDCRLWVGATSGAEVQRHVDYLSITAAQEITTNIPWKLYDEKFNVLESGSLEIIAVSDKEKVAKVIIIGDSLVEGGSATRQKLKSNFENAGGSITFLGTQGTSPLLHEGRGGWKAKRYCTAATYGSVTNPFYNNGFDFSYYMEQQKYDDVDIVVINLGINDIFSQTYEGFTSVESLSYMQDMINSILAYDSTIKVIVNLITPPTSNAELFTGDYGTGQIDFVYLANTIKFAKHTIGRFQNNVYVTLCPTNCVLDTATDFANGVHLNTSGYEKLGQAIYETMNGILELEIVNPPSSYNNRVDDSVESDGSPYNGGLGYKVGYRLRSGGAEAELAASIITGFIPFKIGDTLRISPAFYGGNTDNTLNFYDASFAHLGQVTDSSNYYGICNASYKSTVIDGVSTLTLSNNHDNSIAYVRVGNNAARTANGADFIVTVNEEITL